MHLTAHKQLATYLDTSYASLNQMYKIYTKYNGPNHELSRQIKTLLNSLNSVKQHLLDDIGQITQSYINPYGK